MPATRFSDLAEYRYEVLGKRQENGRDVYVRTGWSLVKYPWTVFEGWEPLDSQVNPGATVSDFKQINGFIFVEDGYAFSETGPSGDVGFTTQNQ